LVDVDLVYFKNVGTTDGPTEALLFDEGGEAFALFLFQDFGIVQTTDGFFGIQNNGGGDNRAEETATTDFVNTGNNAKAEFASFPFEGGPTADGLRAFTARLSLAAPIVDLAAGGHDRVTRLLGGGSGRGDNALFETSGFALEPTQVVELGAAHFAGADHIDVIDDGSVHGEDTFDASAEADLADGDGFAHTNVLARDDGAFKRLQTFLVAFFDADVDADGIAGTELRMSGLAAVLADELGDNCVLHVRLPLLSAVDR